MKVEPRKTFQENKAARDWWQGVVDSTNWQMVTAMALAEYSLHRPTTDQIVGAGNFLAVLTNLAEEQTRRNDPGFNLKPTNKPTPQTDQ